VVEVLVEEPVALALVEESEALALVDNNQAHGGFHHHHG
jgi:hypothetical protein